MGGNRTSKQKYLVCLANPFNDVELKNVKTANRFEKLVKQCGDLIRTYRNTGSLLSNKIGQFDL